MRLARVPINVATTQPPCVNCDRWLSRETVRLSFSWEYATRMDMGFPRILNWRCSGIAYPPIKAIGSHRMTWARCINRETGCYRILKKPPVSIGGCEKRLRGCPEQSCRHVLQ